MLFTHSSNLVMTFLFSSVCDLMFNTGYGIQQGTCCKTQSRTFCKNCLILLAFICSCACTSVEVHKRSSNFYRLWNKNSDFTQYQIGNFTWTVYTYASKVACIKTFCCICHISVVSFIWALLNTNLLCGMYTKMDDLSPLGTICITVHGAGECRRKAFRAYTHLSSK